MIKREMVLREFMERRKGRRSFSEREVKGLLKEMGQNVPRGVFIEKGANVPEIELSYPLVAKLSAADILSKSDVGGVRAGIKNSEGLQGAVKDLLTIEGSEGVLVEEEAPPGIEVIIGGVVDRQFGPVIIFGMGGIFVELFRDAAFALAPVTKKDSLWLISQVKGSTLLRGYRGRPPVDMDALLRAIEAVSEIISSGLIEEVDLNPVALYPGGAIVLDAKMRAL